jgi:hypothetical protein
MGRALNPGSSVQKEYHTALILAVDDLLVALRPDEFLD